MKPYSGTKWELLLYLRKHNSSEIEELREALDRTEPTLREHLNELKAEDLVEIRSKREGPGRPKNLYSLSEQAEAVFPKAYDELARLLYKALEESFDLEHLKPFLVNVAYEHLRALDQNLQNHLKRLGMYPEWEVDENGASQVTYHQCPFYELARENDVLCDVEEEILEKFSETEVTTEQTIARGADTCVFQFREFFPDHLE